MISEGSFNLMIYHCILIESHEFLVYISHLIELINKSQIESNREKKRNYKKWQIMILSIYLFCSVFINMVKIT